MRMAFLSVNAPCAKKRPFLRAQFVKRTSRRTLLQPPGEDAMRMRIKEGKK
jgi:hypothetical protein